MPAATADDVERYYRTIAPFIDQELAERGDEAFWRDLPAQLGARTVLELGGGSGRVTALLAAHGARVLAMDLSSDMLAAARQRLANQPRVRLLQADMTDLCLRTTFDLVVAADDPFSHLTRDADRDRALAAVARHLAPGGHFVLDALWFPPHTWRAATSPAGRTVDHAAEMDGAPLDVHERWHCDPVTHRCQAEYAYTQDDQSLARAAFEARAWTPAELDQRLAAAGLTIEARWGGYDRAPWDPARSAKLLVHARRAAPPA